jgi:hypothetical protein
VTRALVWLLAVVSLFAFGCSSVPAPELPKDPGRVAHDLRVASERACNAYDLCRKLGTCPDDKRADMSCAAVRGVCGEVPPLPE